MAGIRFCVFCYWSNFVSAPLLNIKHISIHSRFRTDGSQAFQCSWCVICGNQSLPTYELWIWSSLCSNPEHLFAWIFAKFNSFCDLVVSFAVDNFVRDKMFLGGEICSSSQQREEVRRETMFNGTSETYKMKRSEKHVRFEVCSPIIKPLIITGYEFLNLRSISLLK